MGEDTGVDPDRRRFLVQATSVLGGLGVLAASSPFLGSWFPSARARALGAPVEADLAKLEPGGQLTVAWRGKPVWIIRRPEAALATLSRPDLVLLLRDPRSEASEQPSYAKNPERSIKPEYIVLIGICTHLGCVPTYRPDLGGIEPGWPGGFFCPCHGSKYDLAGRVYKGVPAPTNLVVPPHHYVSDTVLRIGADPVVA